MQPARPNRQPGLTFTVTSGYCDPVASAARPASANLAEKPISDPAPDAAKLPVWQG